MLPTVISIDGPNFSGKTSVINSLRAYFTNDPTVVFVREPYLPATRELLASARDWESAMDLLYNDRLALLQFVKSLPADSLVFSDRGILSTYVYQGYLASKYHPALEVVVSEHLDLQVRLDMIFQLYNNLLYYKEAHYIVLMPSQDILVERLTATRPDNGLQALDPASISEISQDLAAWQSVVSNSLIRSLYAKLAIIKLPNYTAVGSLITTMQSLINQIKRGKNEDC
jgi:nicotinamide riboside kinase